MWELSISFPMGGKELQQLYGYFQWLEKGRVSPLREEAGTEVRDHSL